ncbi:hypothetical protein SAMN05660297_02773 [Natronincola peptidivorans]|uniref:Uncharacterized protein n=1 Tax=Natronincola peptidivorans TaxID=426128 RepID=A0A1I0FD64_9FIRM|nr:hypothetical protein [Natronincola peptidivorans]SET56211.1 hypothetical protein SAMN05660297_02773 [Natronincola peptidivorans]
MEKHWIIREAEKEKTQSGDLDLMYIGAIDTILNMGLKKSEQLETIRKISKAYKEALEIVKNHVV